MARGIDATLIGTIAVPGVFPARQERSRLAVLGMIDTAIAMLQAGDYDTLGVAELCAAVGVTVGAFYSRFESKEAFFHYLQRVVAEDTRRRMLHDLASQAYADGELKPFLSRVTRGSVLWYRKYEGLIRASLQHVNVDPKGWTVLRDLGRTQVDVALPIILAILRRKQSRRLADAIRFAFQMMNGTLNNMVLLNPGPYSLHDDDTPKLFAETLLLMIETAAQVRARA